jgi:hypothetical protein
VRARQGGAAGHAPAVIGIFRGKMAASHSPAYGYCYEYQLQPAGARAHRHRLCQPERR